MYSGLRSGKFVSGLVIVGAFVLVAIIGPIVVKTDPSAMFSAVLQPPSSQHWLGTTQEGQDVFAEMVDGTRTSLLVGFVAAGLATLLSVVIGITAGFVGGLYDDVLGVVTNIFLVIPALPLVIVLAGYLPSKGWFPIALVIAVTGWAFGRGCSGRKRCLLQNGTSFRPAAQPGSAGPESCSPRSFPAWSP